MSYIDRKLLMVNACSSIGIASTWMVIAGYLFAPLTVVAFAALSIAGGVVSVCIGALAGSSKLYDEAREQTA